MLTFSHFAGFCYSSLGQCHIYAWDPLPRHLRRRPSFLLPSSVSSRGGRDEASNGDTEARFPPRAPRLRPPCAARPPVGRVPLRMRHLMSALTHSQEGRIV